MGIVNIELKAKYHDVTHVREYLRRHADFKGIDHQTDTYLHIPRGRLKLRQGTIENALIYYEREDQKGPKQSNVTLFPLLPDSALPEMLLKALGIHVIVEKQREVYFIGNVKFHLDIVKGLGRFVEIEAIDLEGSIGRERLLEQCQHYQQEFRIRDTDLVSLSYSDLLLGRT